jgi:dGTPase
MAAKSEQIISRIFELYRQNPSALNPSVQAQIPERGLERTICDYIAGMTDRFAVDEYQRLFDVTVLP